MLTFIWLFVSVAILSAVPLPSPRRVEVQS
jgi:hypothetical protein